MCVHIYYTILIFSLVYYIKNCFIYLYLENKINKILYF